MAVVEMADEAGRRLAFESNVAGVEVRTGDVVLVVTETEGGGLLIEARPQLPGIELVTADEQQGEVHRTTIRSRVAV